MRTHAPKLLITLLALTFATPAWADGDGARGPGELPGELDELISLAMERNAEIQRAESQVGMAEAELRAVRIEIAQQVAELHAKRERLQRELRYAEERLAQAEERAEAGRSPMSDAADAESDLMGLESDLDQVELRLTYMAGLGLEAPRHEPTAHEPVRWAPPAPGVPAEAVMNVPRPPLESAPEAVRDYLDSEWEIHFEDTPIADLAAELSDTSPVMWAVSADIGDVAVTLTFEDATVQESLLAITDMHPELVFVVRDYGILATTREHAERIAAPTIPEDVPLTIPAPQGMMMGPEGMMGGMALPGGGFGFGAGSKGGGFGGGGVRAPAMSGGGGGGMMPGRGLRGGATETPAPEPRPEDAEGLAQALKQLGLVFKIYAGENEGLYPPLSPERGVFKPDLGALLPHFLSDPELIQLLEPYGQPEVIYLGHALGDTEQALAFLEAYEQVEPPLWQKDLEVNGHASRVIRALREGIERFFITDINNPAAGAQAQSDLPVLWELPEPGADSGWVLFMDGHVQEVPLGDFPLTPELNERLRGMLRE